jgi:hypothetical protein
MSCFLISYEQKYPKASGFRQFPAVSEPINPMPISENCNIFVIVTNDKFINPYTINLHMTVHYRGMELPSSILLPEPMIKNLGTTKAAYELAPKSTPLALMAGLYLVGRDLASYNGQGLPPELATLPEPVRKAGERVWSYCQQRNGTGAWHRDAVEFLPMNQMPRGQRQPQGNDYVLARYFKNIDGFEDKGGVWMPKIGGNTEVIFPVVLPRGDGWFGVPTYDGMFNPRTGTPIETVQNRDEAIRRFVEAGFTEEQAEREVSRFWRAGVGSNPRAVFSWADGADGPFVVAADSGPRFGGNALGSFPGV